MSDLLSEQDSIGGFLTAIRRKLGFTKEELGVLLGRSAQTIQVYESGRGRPPVVLLLDLLDRLPMLGCTFNEVAARFSYPQVVSVDPSRFSTIHEYVAGVRVFRGYYRAEFAATLKCTPDQLFAYEHREKPDQIVLRRLVARHVRPDFSYDDLVECFQSLRPTPYDLRLRELFAELRGSPVGSGRYVALRRQLIVENLHRAEVFARRYRGTRVSQDDAAQVAAEALVRAVDGCNPRYGDFVPYLRRWVFASIVGAARRTWTTGTAADIRPYGGRVAQAWEALRQQLAREPTPAEIARNLNLPASVVEQTQHALRCRYAASLDDGDATGKKLPLVETLRSADETDGAVQLSDAMRGYLKILGPDARQVIMMRFADDLDIEDIAVRLGRTEQDVADVLTRALQDIRESASLHAQLNRC